MKYGLFLALCLFLFWEFLACTPKKNPKNEVYQALISTYTTNTASKGLYVMEIDLEHTRATPLATIGIANPSYAIHVDAENIYAVSEVDSFAGSKQGAVFHIRLKEGTPIIEDSIASGGTSPCHLSLTKHWLGVANYGSGTATFIRLNDTYGFGKELSFQHYGKGTSDRQASPHAHFLGAHPKYPDIIYGVDLGADKIMIYHAERPMVRKIDSVMLPKGRGPRHLAFDPQQSLAILINELAPSLTLFKIDAKTHRLYPLDHVWLSDTLAPQPSFASGVVIHPSLHTIYALNRGANTISTYTLNEAHTKFELQNVISSGGNFPRSLTLTPDGKYLFVANQKSDTISIFSVHPQDKTLSKLAWSIAIPSPTHLDFIR